MTLNLEEEVKIEFDFDYKEVARVVIEEALDEENFPFEAEVSLTLVDNERIHEINKEFRGIDRPTDVLSFPLIEYNEAGVFDHIEDNDDNFNPDTGEAMLGDIIISQPKVFEQAESYGHSVKREYAFLITHSMLHLMGYDHMTEEEAKVMESKQKLILDKLEITR
ncbi:MAG: rRNA maturation RNase YbeY [Lachnospiraceae bacterium]|nr:rRNA maturation RNase YbeY [Lachnospiraceae bacterium]